MKMSGNRIKTSRGKILHFKSSASRDHWERIAKAIDHGFKPTAKKKGN